MENSGNVRRKKAASNKNTLGCGRSNLRSDLIDQQILEDQDRQSKEIRLLLLGGKDTGKNTMIKQIRIHYGDGFPPNERSKYILSVKENLKEAICLVLTHMILNGKEFADEYAAGLATELLRKQALASSNKTQFEGNIFTNSNKLMTKASDVSSSISDYSFDRVKQNTDETRDESMISNLTNLCAENENIIHFETDSDSSFNALSTNSQYKKCCQEMTIQQTEGGISSQFQIDFDNKRISEQNNNKQSIKNSSSYPSNCSFISTRFNYINSTHSTSNVSGFDENFLSISEYSSSKTSSEFSLKRENQNGPPGVNLETSSPGSAHAINNFNSLLVSRSSEMHCESIEERLNLDNSGEKNITSEIWTNRKEVSDYKLEADKQMQSSKSGKKLKTIVAQPEFSNCLEQMVKTNALPSRELYFLQNVDRFIQNDYLPILRDILITRTPSNGIHEHNLTIGNSCLRLIRLGKQEGTRKKWIHHFDNVNAILFFAAVTDFHAESEEGHFKNKMEESLEFFKYIATSVYFQHTDIILLLTKMDQLKESIAGRSFKSIYPLFEDEVTVDSCANFFHSLFLSKCTNAAAHPRRLFTHKLCLLDIDEMKTVCGKILKSVHDFGLKKHALL